MTDPDLSIEARYERLVSWVRNHGGDPVAIAWACGEPCVHDHRDQWERGPQIPTKGTE